MQELNDILIEIQDHLVPILDSYEQAIYHYIFRHTYLIDKPSTIYSTKSAQIGFGIHTEGTPPSMATRSKKLRLLEAKGAVKIIERSHKGIEVAIILPNEIPNLITSHEVESIDLETLDFYKDRKLMPSILEREEYRCFYTGKKISEDNCYLDHVIAQSAGGDSSYRNIVAASYDANTLKNDKPVDDFMRELYKDDLLSLSEFNSLKQKIVDLQSGKLIPSERTVQEAINS